MRIRDCLARFGAATLLALGPFGVPASPAAAATGSAEAVGRSVTVPDGRTDAFAPGASPAAP
ncbi:hypothetical protein [Streptomyces kanasensis]|uniref:hypothetical protein n=1 Tax=Streptomyces kanasensis TaxID=936756 RepID=UPI003702A733